MFQAPDVLVIYDDIAKIITLQNRITLLISKINLHSNVIIVPFVSVFLVLSS